MRELERPQRDQRDRRYPPAMLVEPQWTGRWVGTEPRGQQPAHLAW
ncbi:hypothetical protein ACFQX7_10100 [Luedemannella flava]